LYREDRAWSFADGKPAENHITRLVSLEEQVAVLSKRLDALDGESKVLVQNAATSGQGAG
ncbi:MAG: hypothetical protein KUG75_06695, partial [Pseudomonadales bacterium]|nr:hypothetical protein [Pseudomonadales bacterium]